MTVANERNTRGSFPAAKHSSLPFLMWILPPWHSESGPPPAGICLALRKAAAPSESSSLWRRLDGFPGSSLSTSCPFHPKTMYRLMRRAVGSDNLVRVLHLAATRTIVYTGSADRSRLRRQSSRTKTKRSGLQVIHPGLQQGPGLSSGLQRRVCVAKGSWGLKLVCGVVQRAGGRYLPLDRAAERDPGQPINRYRGADVVRLQLSNGDFPHGAAG